MKKRTVPIFLWLLAPAIIGVLALSLVTLPGMWNAMAGQGASPWGDNPSRRNKGPIMFELTPQGVAGGQFLVEIRVDTHAGNLGSLDLIKQVRLKADGRSYSPVKATRLGGHHAGGTMVFPLNVAPKRFEIIILAVGTMGDLTFRWP